MFLVPSWRVLASVSPPADGASALCRPEMVLLSVADDDLETLLRVLKRNGYEKIEANREEFPQIGAIVHKQEVTP